MSANGLKSKFANFLIALANLISKNKEKKQLSQESFQEELEKFVKDNGISVENLNSEKFQDDFMQYLKNQNYDCEGMKVLANIEGSEDIIEKNVKVKKLPTNITKISEDLNEYTIGLDVFVNTLNMMPGLVCYTVEQVPPTDKKPYVTYRPTPRVITQIHESGVNGGTIFLTRSHKFVKSMDFKGEKTPTVIAEDEVLYTPLTREHALYVCKILNAQSRLFYIQQMKRQQRTK